MQSLQFFPSSSASKLTTFSKKRINLHLSIKFYVFETMLQAQQHEKVMSFWKRHFYFLFTSFFAFVKFFNWNSSIIPLFYRDYMDYRSGSCRQNLKDLNRQKQRNQELQRFTSIFSVHIRTTSATHVTFNFFNKNSRTLFYFRTHIAA